jgi:hypothetical protein
MLGKVMVTVGLTISLMLYSASFASACPPKVVYDEMAPFGQPGHVPGATANNTSSEIQYITKTLATGASAMCCTGKKEQCNYVVHYSKYEQSHKETDKIEQSVTFSTPLAMLFHVLTGGQFSTEKKSVKTREFTRSLLYPAGHISCGSQLKVYLVHTRTVTRETRTHGSETGTRIKETENYGLDARSFGSLQTYDSCTDLVSGPDCPVINIVEPCDVEPEPN